MEANSFFLDPKTMTNSIEEKQTMLAQVVRADRYGNPATSLRKEEISMPTIGEDEVLVAVMCAGLNYNSIWSAMGYPIDIIKLINQEDFHIAGSDGSGIVYKVGSKVTNVKVGDEVVLAPIYYDPNDPHILAGRDETLAPSGKAWGYETNWGSFGEFCKVKYFQCLKKPSNLSWEESATYLLSAATAYRMLLHHTPHTIKKGDVVAIWGGAGGLGTMALQICLLHGAIPVCIVSSQERKEFCEKMGAKAILRTNQTHWGALDKESTTPAKQNEWRNEAKKLLKELQLVTNGVMPQIVIEHPGESTLPTSVFMCDKGGMVVTCAGTTGYLGSFDLRYLWLAKKRLQGSHGASLKEFQEVNQLFAEGKLKPVLSDIVDFEDLPNALSKMLDNNHQPGSIAVRIGNR